MPNVASLVERTVRWVRLPERIPALAFSGEDTAVDLILHEVLSLLADEVKADIGHINLLPKGGRVEKVCTIKDGQPWLRREMDLHLFDPYHGFTGEVFWTQGSQEWARVWRADLDGSNPRLLDDNLNGENIAFGGPTTPAAEPTTIPEPSTLAIWSLLSVAVGFGVWRKRRKR